jgi:hypothetical protein
MINQLHRGLRSDCELAVLDEIISVQVLNLLLIWNFDLIANLPIPIL